LYKIGSHSFSLNSIACSSKEENGFKPSRRGFLKYHGTAFIGACAIYLSNSCSFLPRSKSYPYPPIESRSTDVVIVGSGITGLCTGAIMAKLGYRVTVLEAHPDFIGGHARSIDIHGLRFCAGPQYLWNFASDPDAIGNRVLHFLKLENMTPFLLMDKCGFEKIFVGDYDGFDIPMGIDCFRDAMINRFPYEKDNLNKFFDYFESCFEGAKFLEKRGLYLEDMTSMMYAVFFSASLSIKTKYHLFRLFDKSLSDLFSMCDLSEEARRLLYGHGAIFAENPSNVSVGVYAAATGYYHAGATYPKFGFHSIVKGLESVITGNGGRVLSNKKVVSFGVKKDAITSVRCADGSAYSSDVVISTLSPRLNCDLMTGCRKEAFQYSPSNSLLCAFIGLNDYPYLSKLARKNFWWQAYPEKVDFDNPDMLAEPTMIYVSSSTASGIIYSDQTSSLQALTVFAPGSFEQAKEAFNQGTRHYSKLKSEISEKVLARLESKLLPELRNHVSFIEILTPWDIHKELGSEAGNVYGRRLNAKSVLRKVKTIDSVHNLHIACATMGEPGIATAFQTSSILVEKLSGVKV